MATKKVKRKKISFKRILIVLLTMLILTLLIIDIIHKPLQNIYITGNSILTDKEIIEIAKLTDYPPYINTYFIDIKDKLLKNKLIKDVKIKRKVFGKIYIEIEEYKPICIYQDNIVLSSKGKIINNTDINYLPLVTNNIDNIYNKFVDAFSKIDNDILLKISHIEYSPNEVDKERFILHMIDSNYVHITLSKIEKVNKYNIVVTQLENKKGIIYLDSGDYVEIKG